MLIKMGTPNSMKRPMSIPPAAMSFGLGALNLNSALLVGRRKYDEGIKQKLNHSNFYQPTLHPIIGGCACSDCFEKFLNRSSSLCTVTTSSQLGRLRRKPIQP